MNTFNLFVYGTLMYKDTFKYVTGYSGPMEVYPATLYDFERLSVSHGIFPAILPKGGKQVDGMLVQGIPCDRIFALDAYEGEGRLYNRQLVAVQVGTSMQFDKVMASAYTYVWNSKREYLKQVDWIPSKARPLIETIY